jgi:hypothetical protein
MSNEVDRGRSGKIEVLLAVRIPQIRAHPAHRWGESFAEGTPQQGRSRRILSSSLTRHWGIIQSIDSGCQKRVAANPAFSF